MDLHKNFIFSTVATAPSPASSGTSLVLRAGDGASLQAPPFNVIVAPAGAQPSPANAEVARCTAVATDTLTIVRQQENSSARTIVVGDQVIVGPTAKTYTDIEAISAALQNGVQASGDCALSGVSVASGTGVVTYTLAAGSPLWVTSASGILTPVFLSALTGQTLTPGALPASGKYRGYGIEVDVNGAVTLSAGGSDQTTLALALANINTVPAAGKVRVADIVLLNTAGAYSNAGTRDRRPWARGGLSRQTRTSNASAGNDYTTTAGPGLIDGANLSIRMECSGVPVRLTLLGNAYNTSVSNAWSGFGFYVDGATFDALNGGITQSMITTTTNQNIPLNAQWVTVPSAGSHLFQPVFQTGAGTLHLQAAATAPCVFAVEELMAVNSNNGTS